MASGLSPQVVALMQTVAGALQAGDEGTAENALRQIVAENPRHADAWHMLAGLIIRAGRGGEAIESALRAHELDRRNSAYLNTLGIAYAEAQQLNDAVRVFKRSLKERPGRADSHYNLGKAHARLGELAEAERCYLRAGQLDPERAEVINTLVALYSQQGRYHDALPLLARARAGRKMKSPPSTARSPLWRHRGRMPCLKRSPSLSGADPIRSQRAKSWRCVSWPRADSPRAGVSTPADAFVPRQRGRPACGLAACYCCRSKVWATTFFSCASPLRFASALPPSHS